jgi:hypothetical protein
MDGDGAPGNYTTGSLFAATLSLPSTVTTRADRYRLYQTMRLFLSAQYRSRSSRL